MAADQNSPINFQLPPAPARRAASQDWYRTVGLTLAWVALVGVAVALLASLLLLPEWFSRVGLTLAGLALAAHVALSVALSRTPRLEA